MMTRKKMSAVSVLSLCLVALAVIVTAGRPGTAARAEAGRLLSDREMASLVGDTDGDGGGGGGNLLCRLRKDCTCTQTGTVNGQSVCIKCDDQNDFWYICAVTTDATKNCSSDKDSDEAHPCQLRAEYASTSWTPQSGNACNPCVSTTGLYVATGNNCIYRINATGTPCQLN
jgi:hypothetical protein